MGSWLHRQWSNLTEACSAPIFFGTGLILYVVLSSLWNSSIHLSPSITGAVAILGAFLCAFVLASGIQEQLPQTSFARIALESVAGCFPTVVGTLLLESFPLIGTALIVVGATALLLFWARFYSELQLRGRVVGTAAADIIACTLWVLTSLLPAIPYEITAIAASVVSALLLTFATSVSSDNLAKKPSAKVHAVSDVHPIARACSTFVPLGVRSFIIALCFGAITLLVIQVARHYRDYFGYISLASSASCLVAAVVISILMAKVTKRESAFMAYFPTSLLVVIGAILLGFSGGSPTLISVACVLSFAGINIYLTYHWIILGNHAMQSDLPAHLIYGGGFLALALGAILGTGIGSMLNATATYGTWAEHFAIALIALAFFAPFLIANGASLAGETKRMGGTPYGQTVISEEERVDVAAKHFGLTSREKEILLLLYQGRSVPYICNELFIAESTVRTHLKHIYAKAEIGSRQDLIDAIRNL